MSSFNKYNKLIRTQKDLFETPNIYSYNGDKKVELHFEYFRNNRQDKELILFVKHEDKYYLPLWSEFRLINNNILYLIFEYNITDFSMIKRVLQSSLEKEEHSVADFKAILYKVNERPPHCVELPKLAFANSDIIMV